MRNPRQSIFIMHKELYILLYRTWMILLLAYVPADAVAQNPVQDVKVRVVIDSIQHPMRPLTTQTEIKRGWEIQGIRVGGRTVRYMMGSVSRQFTSETPTFAIYPENNLNDYAVIRLKERRDYRMLPAPTLQECTHIRVELGYFAIRNLEGMGFAVTPLKPLFPGEYILVDMSQEPVNKQGDFVVYDFSVEATSLRK